MIVRDHSVEAIEEQIEAALIKAGFAELELREKITTEEWLSKKENKEMAQASFLINSLKVHRLIKNSIMRKKVARCIYVTAPRMAKVAICVLLVFYLGLTVAVATIEDVRVGVYKFFIRVDKKYTELILDQGYR